MAVSAAEILAPAHFLDHQLRPLHRSQHFGRNSCALEGGLPQFKAVATDREHALEAQLLAHALVTVIDDELFSLTDFVLAAAIGERMDD